MGCVILALLVFQKFIIASEPIMAKETLVSLPKELLLTTRHAFESPLKQIFMDYP